VVVGIILILVCILSTWKKVPADKAAIITGIGKSKVVTGGGSIVIPILQRIDYITLENINFEVSMRGTFTADTVPVETDGVVVVKIKNEESMIRSAMEQFYCGKESETRQHIMETSRDVCEGRLREIIADMTAEQLYKDRKTFGERVQEVAAEQLGALGLELKSFTIKGISDQNGYFEALSQPKIAAAKRDAEIAQAEAGKESMIKTSEAKRIGAQAQLEAEAMTAETQKNAEVKKLKYQGEQETGRAQADAAYLIQQHITQKEVTNAEMDAKVLNEQREREVAEAQIAIEIAREMKNIELAERKAERKEKELMETQVKPAEAAKQVQELSAEAAKIKAIKEAEADAEAKKLNAAAEAEYIKKQGEAAAEVAKAKGLAEAEVIRQRGIAEAEAIRQKGLAEAEALNKRADALAKIEEAGKLQMVMDILPEVAKAIAEPMGRIGNISIIGGGGEDGGGAADVTRMSVGALKSVIDGVKDTIGFDLTEIMRAKTFEGQTTSNVNVTGLEGRAIAPVAPEGDVKENYLS